MESGYEEDDGLQFDDCYKLGEVVGRGPFSSVRRCTHIDTGKQFGVKIVDVAKFTSYPGHSIEDLKREAVIWRLLSHPHIVELVQTYTSGALLYMVFEDVDGDDLCFEIVRRATAGFVYSEAVCSHYMKQILEALRYCHDNAVIHRDIKPECVLLSSRENSAPLKVTDLAMAMQLPDGRDTISGGRIGSVPNSAPELLSRSEYGRPADMWSLGVLLYTLLSGSLPFHGNGTSIYDNGDSIYTNRDPEMEGEVWSPISDSGRDLVINLLRRSPESRFTINEALNHPWIRSRASVPRDHLPLTVERMRRYNACRTLKGDILSAVSSPHWLDLSEDHDPDMTSTGGRGFQADIDRASTSSAAVSQILESLDAIHGLTGGTTPTSTSSSFLHQVFADRQLTNLLQLYDRISSSQWSDRSIQSSVETTQSALGLMSYLESKPPPYPPKLGDSQPTDPLLTPSDKAGSPHEQRQALLELLSKPYLQSLMQTHDVVVREVYTGRQSGGTGSGATSPLAQPTTVQKYSNGDGSMARTTSMNDDIVHNDHTTRVRLVQFQRNSDEPLGITLKMTEEGKCVVARILYGGMIHRQGTLHVGDELREINGTAVVNQSVEALQQLLKEARGSVVVKIVPSYRNNPTQCEMFVRALFEYDPSMDDLNPCPQAGVQFKIGDLLQIISKDDPDWWQALKLDERELSPPPEGSKPAGLIPSRQMQETRTVCQALERSKKRHASSGNPWWQKKRKHYKDKYLAKHNSVFDQLDVVTYEEVVSVPNFRRKTLVLLGAHGVGRRHIKNSLIMAYPDKYAYPLPHTTKTPRAGEEEGGSYHFVSHEAMMKGISNNEYLEYGTHEEAMYGTKLETIREIHRANKMAILDVEPQALRVLRSSDFSPYIIFIGAPSGAGPEDGSLERLVHDSTSLESSFGHYFDLKLVNNDIDETIECVEEAVVALSSSPHWVPVSWVY